jgi:hypothetical protein
MAYHRRAPIDVYWELMAADKPDEAAEILRANPDDAACILEFYCANDAHGSHVEYVRRAAELGHPVAMAALGEHTDDVEMLQKAMTSGSLYARVLAHVALLRGGGGNAEFAETLEQFDNVIEERESPRVFLSLLAWLELLPERFQEVFETRQLERMCCQQASDAGVPRGIYLHARTMLSDPGTPTRNREIVRLLNRPSLRNNPDSIDLLAICHAEFSDVYDLGKAAKLMLSLPVNWTTAKLRFLARVICCGPSISTGHTVPADDLCRASCLFGRALALGTVGLPPIPANFAQLGKTGDKCMDMLLIRTLPEDLGVDWSENEGYAVNWQFLKGEWAFSADKMDGAARCIDSMARFYRRWIAAVRDAIFEFLLVARLQAPTWLPTDVARLIAAMVWNARERDAPIWCPITDTVSYPMSTHGNWGSEPRYPLSPYPLSRNNIKRLRLV